MKSASSDHAKHAVATDKTLLLLHYCDAAKAAGLT